MRMALGETQIVQETRQFLLDNSVCLDSFSQVCDMIWTNSIRIVLKEERFSVILPICFLMYFVHAGCGTEEHKRDPGEKPSSWSGVVRAGGAVLSSRLFRPSAASPLRTHCHHRVPRANRGQTSFHTTGVQQGVLNFLQAVDP